MESVRSAMGSSFQLRFQPQIDAGRQSCRRTVVKPYLNAAGDLAALFLEPSIEQTVESAVEHGEHNSHLTLSPKVIRDILNRIENRMGAMGGTSVAVASSGSRYFLRQIVEASHPNLFFISHSEVPPGVKVLSLGVIQ